MTAFEIVECFLMYEMMIHFDPGCIDDAIERVFQIVRLKRHNRPDDSDRNIRAACDFVCIPQVSRVNREPAYCEHVVKFSFIKFYE